MTGYKLSEVPAIVESETGWKPSRQTVYLWANRGWLKIEGFRPLRATLTAIRDCLAEHKQVR